MPYLIAPKIPPIKSIRPSNWQLICSMVIHIQNTGILATYQNIIIKRNYVVTPAQYELRPVIAAFMFVVPRASDM